MKIRNKSAVMLVALVLAFGTQAGDPPSPVHPKEPGVVEPLLQIPDNSRH
jgi:hypothetical protein